MDKRFVNKVRRKWLFPACMAVGFTVAAVWLSNDLSLAETVVLAIVVGLLVGFLGRALVSRKRSGDQ